MVPKEQNTLRGQILLNRADQIKEGATTTPIGARTKCHVPVYYDSNHGWVECHTFISEEELCAMGAKVIERENILP